MFSNIKYLRQKLIIKKNQLMELMDFPCDIDLERLEESLITAPHDWWNYTEYQGSWYHKEKDRSVIQTRSLLKLAKRDYGINFKTNCYLSTFAAKSVFVQLNIYPIKLTRQ